MFIIDQRLQLLFVTSTFLIFLNSSFNEVVLKYYQEQSSKKSLVASWIQALPLLHFLREESVPFEDLICAKPVDIKTWKWWGLGDFSFREIRRHIERFGLYICPVILACVCSVYGLFTHGLLSFGIPFFTCEMLDLTKYFCCALQKIKQAIRMKM